MEFFSVMEVAQHFGIGCLGIFCVSNYCNANAHRDFLDNHTRVKERLESLAAILASRNESKHT